MLKMIKRWLGWEGHSGFDFGDLQPRRRPSSATASVLTNGPRARTSAPTPPPPPKLRGEGATLSIENEPGKTAKGATFDPYNTGKFDRSASWERISRNQR